MEVTAMALQVKLLEQSFEGVKPNADAFAASFYGNLFADFPQTQALFAHSDMEAQQQKLLASLVLVVENLRQPQVLSEALQSLGNRHANYGIVPEHYPMVGTSLLKTFETYLGDAWTPEVKQAWVDAYGAITGLMLTGAES
jgi:hemoglobin-like flavoprotein